MIIFFRYIIWTGSFLFSPHRFAFILFSSISLSLIVQEKKQSYEVHVTHQVIHLLVWLVLIFLTSPRILTYVSVQIYEFNLTIHLKTKWSHFAFVWKICNSAYCAHSYKHTHARIRLASMLFGNVSNVYSQFVCHFEDQCWTSEYNKKMKERETDVFLSTWISSDHYEIFPTLDTLALAWNWNFWLHLRPIMHLFRLKTIYHFRCLHCCLHMWRYSFSFSFAFSHCCFSIQMEKNVFFFHCNFAFATPNWPHCLR